MKRLIPLMFFVLGAVSSGPDAEAQPAPVASMTPKALMAEGNKLFRDGLYRVALLRYREARAAGLDTPLLHYNLGVVLYRVEQYADSLAAFERSAQAPALTAVAHYNMGLVANALGDNAAAENWFQSAADRAGRGDLRDMAERSLDRLSSPAAAPVQERAARRTLRSREDPVGEFNFLAIANYGENDNVYRSPAAPYVDLAQPGQPIVTPVVQAASFSSVDLLAEYVLFNEAGDTDFNFTYLLNGDFYSAEFSNANEISQKFEIGATIDLKAKENRTRRLQSAFFFRDHQETNFDPDSGLDRDVNGVDISDRFSYVAGGLEGGFEHRFGRWSWNFDMRLERRLYDNILLVRSYDHDFYFARAGFEYSLNADTRLLFSGRSYRRHYEDRLARDANGALLSTNLGLQYDYSGVQAGIERDIGRSLQLNFDYMLLTRTDAFQGYADYDQDVIRFGVSYRPHPKFRLRLSAISRSYDYPTAFAFNDLSAERKSLEDMGINARIEYRVSSKLGLRVEFNSEDLTSTDPRAEFARTRSLLGVTWRL